MHPIRRILVTTDLSETSEIALPWAEMLGKRFGARIKLLFVIQPNITDYYPYLGFAETIDMAVARSDARNRMARMIQQRSIRHEVDIEIAVDPSPSLGIIKTAERELFDLIVMNTHGRTGLGHFIMGSVAERVVQHSKVPVLCTRGGPDPYLEERSVQRVLCPTDLSRHSLRGVRAGAEIAQSFQAQVDVLHVARGDPGEHAGVSYTHADDQSLWEVREQLTRLIPQAEFPGVKISYHIMRGQPARCVNQFADENDCDLSVIATHGHDAVKDILLGSTAERVLRHSIHPVFIVPSQVREARSETPVTSDTIV